MTKAFETEVVVIGGGIAGVCSAYYLARRGARVVLFERGAVGAQASGVNFGGLRTNGRAEPELPLSLRARAQWQKIETLVGDNCETEITGHVEICDRPEHMAAVEQWAGMAETHGVGAQLLSAADVARRFPWIGTKVLGGCFVAGDGAANPRLVTPVFAIAACKLGVDIREHDAVRTIRHDGGCFQIESESGTGVRAPILVNAAGAWGARLAAQFSEVFPLDVMAPQMVVSEPFARVVTSTVDYPVNGRFFYARQIGRGNLLFGRGPGRADLDLGRARYVPQNLFDASRIAVDVLPFLRGRNFIRTWAGVEGKSPDSLPFLGKSRAIDGLIHAFGFSGHGFQLGPGIGEVVAELALNGRTSTQIEGFDPYRFAKHSGAMGNAPLIQTG
ncbi:MAG: FAD-binding oxidoreductase [Mesorhizobium sp.]|uniref:NAD(P)/FAD-dependent oxidoreductase n=1 Tax=Mesorhizobium sp. TaxID=1871066 RepID=UPI001AC5EC4C|nr:FAD-binding oxidoreductase [Mesorhizobium sp.]MBN9217299.1 FAD-binding oxidoreductase [Mesorhizobium sp.]